MKLDDTNAWDLDLRDFESQKELDLNLYSSYLETAYVYRFEHGFFTQLIYFIYKLHDLQLRNDS